jgi:HPt (histidine-containing phosphotransfer) domain-containing protein
MSFTDGDPQLERELGSLYLASAGLYLEEMRAALRAGGDWRGAAHSLKGASANIGAVEVAALAAEAEKAAPSPELLRRLAQAVETVRRFFDERHGAAAMARKAPSLEA